MSLASSLYKSSLASSAYAVLGPTLLYFYFICQPPPTRPVPLCFTLYTSASTNWACLSHSSSSGFRLELIAYAFLPLAAIGGVLFIGCSWNAVAHVAGGRGGRPSLAEGLLLGLPAATLIALCCAPAASSKA